MSFNWNNAAENTIAGGLGMVPEVGSLLSALVSILWPQSDDVWSQIKGQVEQLIKQDLSELVYQDVQNDLSGLKGNMADYLTAVSSKDDHSVIADFWITADGSFDNALPHFQSKGYELLLLPLFAQFANLNLSLLRDGMLFGHAWGWDQNTVDDLARRLEQKIQSFTEYANSQYETGYFQRSGMTLPNLHLCEPFRSVNIFVRQMTFSVLDYVNLWPYFGKANQPDNPMEINVNREIYSDPVGTCDDSGIIFLPSPPTMPISQFTVWGGDFVDAVQLTYPDGGGPNGKTVTPRMGTQPGQPNQSAGSDQPPHGGVFDVSNNPLKFVIAYAGDVVNCLQFNFKDGDTKLVGTNNGKTVPYFFSYPREIVSSIHINGISNFYGSADCAVFGFKYEQSQKADLDALGQLYIASPSGETLNDLAARCVTRQVAMDELTAKASTESWDNQRAKYWKYLEAQTLSTQHA